jgi:hypothetical protein
METEYAKYEDWQQKLLEAIAVKWNLGCSCASDFHGKFEGETMEGRFSIVNFWNLRTLKENIYSEK